MTLSTRVSISDLHFGVLIDRGVIAVHGDILDFDPIGLYLNCQPKISHPSPYAPAVGLQVQAPVLVPGGVETPMYHIFKLLHTSYASR